MKLVIAGYGKMGHEIEKAAPARSHQIIAALDNQADWEAQADIIRKADAVIEFSTPASVIDNIRRSFDLHLPVIVGTTGWHEQQGSVRKWCEEEGQSIFVASNFSIGVNILFALTHQLARLLNKAPDFEISLEEIHHIHKLDAPSGTAIQLAEIILEAYDKKSLWVNRVQETPDELEIISRREGEVTGRHIIRSASENEILTIVHEAKDRTGFANGALMAAEWLQGRKGWYIMANMLQLT